MDNSLKVKEWFIFRAEFDLNGILGVVEETEKAVKFLVEEFTSAGIKKRTYWCPKSVILEEDWKNYQKVYWNDGWRYSEDDSLVVGQKFLYV